MVCRQSIEGGWNLKLAIVTPGVSPFFGSGIPLGAFDTLAEMSKFLKLSLYTLAESNEKFTRLAPLARTYGIDINKVDAENILPSFLTRPIIRGYPSPASLVSLRDVSFLRDADTVISLEPFSPLTHQLVGYCRKRGKKLITISFENLISTPLLRLPPYRFYTESYRKSGNLLWAATCRTADVYKMRGFSDNNIEVCYFGIDTDRYFRRQEHNHRNTKLLYVGGLWAHKGIRELVEAFEIVSKRQKDVRMIICGDGPLRGWLESRIKNNRLSIDYLGAVPHSHLPAIYSEADIFISPSKAVFRFGMKIWEEQFGFTLVEAMASSLPIITSTSGSILEVIGNGNFLLPNVNVENLAKLIEHTISLSPAELHAIGEKNRARVCHHFDARVNANKILSMAKNDDKYGL